MLHITNSENNLNGHQEVFLWRTVSWKDFAAIFSAIYKGSSTIIYRYGEDQLNIKFKQMAMGILLT